MIRFLKNAAFTAFLFAMALAVALGVIVLASAVTGFTIAQVTTLYVMCAIVFGAVAIQDWRGKSPNWHLSGLIAIVLMAMVVPFSGTMAMMVKLAQLRDAHA